MTQNFCNRLGGTGFASAVVEKGLKRGLHWRSQCHPSSVVQDVSVDLPRHVRVPPQPGEP